MARFLLCGAADFVFRQGDLALRSAAQGSMRLEDMSLEEVEAFLIKKALARYNGNVSHAANQSSARTGEKGR